MAKGRIPIEFRSLMEDVRKRTTVAQRALDDEMSSIQRVCTKGCSACCHQMVYVHAWEEVVIHQYLQTVMYEKTKKIVRKQLLAWWRTFVGMLDRRPTQASPLTHAEQLHVQRKMREQRIACPFLIDDECSIYDVRPAVCRTHVVTSDPTRCNTDPHRQGDPRALAIFMSIFGAESQHIPRTIYPHMMKPLAYIATDVIRVPVPSTPMEGYLLDGNSERL